MRLLNRPLWIFIVALWGLVFLVVLLAWGIIYAIASIFHEESSPWIWISCSIAYPIIGLFFSRFLWHFFVRVIPSAIKHYRWDDGPWLHVASQPNPAVVINWITSQPGSTRVEFGKIGSTLQVIEGDPGKVHRIFLRDLQPGQRYQYRVIDFPHDQAIHQFNAVPDDTMPITFVVVGDTQNGGGLGKESWGYPRIVDTWKDLEFDLFLHTGDATDQGNDIKSWHAFLAQSCRVASSRPMNIVVGNHDTGSSYMHDPTEKKCRDDGANFDFILGYQYGAPPWEDEVTAFRGRYYSFDYGPCHFLFIDTQNQKLAVSWSPQWNFIDEDLGRCNPNLWKIVFIHWPLIEIKKEETAGYRYKFTHYARFVMPLLDKHGVDLVLQGHAHVFQNITWEYGPATPFFQPSHDWPHHPIRYITSGGGGNEFRVNPPNTPEKIPLPGFEWQENSTHYCHVVVSPSEIRVEARYPNQEIMDKQVIHVLRKEKSTISTR